MKKYLSFCLLIVTTTIYSQFNDYVPQNPVNEMRDVGVSKQRIYDSRKDWIQNRVTNLVRIIDRLITKEDFPNENINFHKAFLVEKIKSYNSTIGYIDFADNYQYSIIQKDYKNIENYCFRYYDELMLKVESKIGYIGIKIEQTDGFIKINEVIFGSSAWKSNQLEINDRIVKVGQGNESLINIDGMTVDDVRELIIGKKGTFVRLTIQKKDYSYRTIAIMRE